MRHFLFLKSTTVINIKRTCFFEKTDLNVFSQRKLTVSVHETLMTNFYNCYIFVIYVGLLKKIHFGSFINSFLYSFGNKVPIRP
jgi:hypothetical protein